MTTRTTYRLYLADDGKSLEYCGEFNTIDEAKMAADRSPNSLPESLWPTARAAGHCGGLSAPDEGVDDTSDVAAWHDDPDGKQFGIVRVTYND